MNTSQACTGQVGQPRLGNGLQCGFRFYAGDPRVALSHESPGYKFGVQLPAQTPGAEIGAQVGGGFFRNGQVVVAKQLYQVRTARLPRLTIDAHDHVRNDHGHAHGLGGPCMHLIVQGESLKVVLHACSSRRRIFAWGLKLITLV